MMELNTLYYFVELTKDLRMTTTASRLYVSQQSLSNHIRRLEKHYGLSLFHRHPKLQLTVAGRKMLTFAEQVLLLEKNIKGELSDVVELDQGEIIIGASSPRSSSYLPQILPKFTAKYPNVQVILVDKKSDQLEELVLKNELDFAVCVEASKNQSNLKTNSILNDQIYFCVPDKLLHQYYGENAMGIKKKSFSGAELADFSKLPFLTITPNNRLGKCLQHCFIEAGYTPHSYMNTTYTTMTVPFCNQGLAACFTSNMNLSVWKSQLADNVNVFPLHSKGNPICMTIDLIHHRQRYLTRYVRYFMDLTADYFRSLANEQLAYIT